jgi:iron complex outermembrane receptor protein
LGVELQGAAVVNQFLKASANLTVSRNKVLNFTEYIDAYDANFSWTGQNKNFYKSPDISFSPDIVGAAAITVTPFQKLNIDLLSKYVSKQYLDNTNNEARKLNTYFTEDARAIYSFNKSWLKNVDLIFQVNNLFNKKYEANGYTYSYYYDTQLVTENFYYPMAGTNFFAGVNIKL